MAGWRDDDGRNEHIGMCKWDSDIRGVFQFGGQQQQQRAGLGLIDVWLFRPDVNTWHKLTSIGGVGDDGHSPTARQDPAVQIIRQNGANDPVQVLLFGGLGYSTSDQQMTYLADTWVGQYVSDLSTGYNPKMRWTPFCGVDAAELAGVTGDAKNPCGPSGRRRATTYIYRNVFYVFGGESPNGGLLNDMWSCDIATHTWTEIPQSYAWPTPRARTAFARLYVTEPACGIQAAVNESIGMMFGGQVGGTNFLEESLLTATNETWAFSFAESRWYNCSISITGTREVTPDSTFNFTDMPALIGPVSGGIHPLLDADDGTGQVMVVYGGMGGISSNLCKHPEPLINLIFTLVTRNCASNWVAFSMAPFSRFLHAPTALRPPPHNCHPFHGAPFGSPARAFPAVAYAPSQTAGAMTPTCPSTCPSSSSTSSTPRRRSGR